ncbi:MAG: hypothetical protein U0P82_04300 [Vicinamibacterales bacterium]
MTRTHAPLDDAFDRLQHVLLGMRTGDELALRDASRISGLSEPTCRTVLEGLARAGLMSHGEGDRFVRVSTV